VAGAPCDVTRVWSEEVVPQSPECWRGGKLGFGLGETWEGNLTTRTPLAARVSPHRPTQHVGVGGVAWTARASRVEIRRSSGVLEATPARRSAVARAARPSGVQWPALGIVPAPGDSRWRYRVSAHTQHGAYRRGRGWGLGRQGHTLLFQSMCTGGALKAARRCSPIPVLAWLAWGWSAVHAVGD
jgi:hypothetical protein